MRHPVRHVLAAFVCAACITPGFTRAAEPAELLSAFGSTRLVLTAGELHCILFDVYVADNNELRGQGLMHIRKLGMREGMLFIYPQPRRISMWMKNTLIPLDMLFFDGSGNLVRVHSGAVPLSTDVIDSGVPASLVLELNAGAARYFRIGAADRIVYPYALAGP